MLARPYLLKLHLNILTDEDDREIMHYLEVAEQFVKQYCNRQFEYGQYTEQWIYDEIPRRNDEYMTLRLKETPVDIGQAVNVYVDDNLVQNNPVIVKEDGRILLDVYPMQSIKVVYYGGYHDPAGDTNPKVPADLEQAIITFAGLLYQEKKGTFGVNTVVLSNETINKIEQFVPERVKRILDYYRVRGI